MAKKVLIVFGVVLTVFGIWKFTKGKSPESYLDRDRKILSDSKSTEPQIFGALIRLSHSGDSGARQMAMDRRGHNSPMIREACAAALGYFDDQQSVSALIEMLRDKETRVRVKAIEALSFKFSKERLEAVEKVLSTPSLSISEEDAAYSSILRMGPKADMRSKAVAGLIRIGKGGGTITDSEANLAVSHLISLAPGDVGVNDLLREIVKAGKRNQVMPMSIRRLAANQDSWLRSNMAMLEKTGNPQVRQTVIQTLHMACPVDRWEILKKVLNGSEKDISVLRAAIQGLAAAASPQALKIAEELKARAKFERNEMMALQNTIALLKKGNMTDPCMQIINSNVPTAKEKKK